MKIILIIVILFTLSFITYKYIEKNSTEKKINVLLNELGIKDKIEKRKMIYDYKRGVYFLEAYFKDEPNNRYEINLVEIDNDLLIMAYNKNNEQITDNKKAKYISYKYD